MTTIIWLLITIAVAFVSYSIGRMRSGPVTPVLENEDAMKQRMRGGERL